MVQQLDTCGQRGTPGDTGHVRISVCARDHLRKDAPDARRGSWESNANYWAETHSWIISCRDDRA